MGSAALTDADVVRLARQAFKHAPEPWQAPEIQVRAMPNFEGEDALYVMAIFPDDVSQFGGPKRVDVQIALGDLLLAQNDHRLVYLSALTRSDLAALRALETETPSDAA